MEEIAPSEHEQPSWFNRIPYEIYSLIAEHLHSPDIMNFLLSCKRMLRMMHPQLLMKDIKARKYNSLAWACYFGDSSLARACLESGASPNATFWPRGYEPDISPRRLEPPYSVDLTFRPHVGCDIQDLIAIQPPKDRPDLEFPALPDKKVSGRQFLETVMPFSALCVATLRNHVSVMRVLLEFGARQFDHRRKIDTILTPWCDRPFCAPYPSLDHPHQVALSHVRSVSAAKLLLEAGGKDYINECGDCPFTPLEMVLSRFTTVDKNPSSPGTPPNHLTHVCTFDSEVEASLLIKLLLDNGASPRRPIGRVLCEFTKVRACDGPLEAAIATGVPSLVKLVFQHGPADPSHPENAEFTDIIQLALLLNIFPKGRGCFNPLNPLGDRLFAKLQEFGFPIVESIARLAVQPLPTEVHDAVENNERWNEFDGPIATILRVGVNVNHSGPSQLCALSQVVAASTFRHDDHPEDDDEADDSVHAVECQYIRKLLNNGANIDNPAFGPQGFTPLFIATSEQVPSRVFKRLILAGGDRTGQRQLLPGEPSYTLLQCLLMGMPTATTERDDTRWPERLIHKGHRWRSWLEHLDYLRQRRHAKFHAWAEVEVNDSLRSPCSGFYVHGNKHILIWAIEKLDDFRLMDSVSDLSRLYSRTKREEDGQHPLLILFSEQERQGHLSIGTLEQKVDVVRSIVDNIYVRDEQIRDTDGYLKCPQLGYTNEDGETVLHLVCQLSMSIPTDESFSQVRRQVWTSSGRYFDFRQGYSIRFDSDSHKLIFGENIGRETIHNAYSRFRKESISNILNYLLAHSLENALWVPDKNGITAYKRAEDSGLLDLILPCYRNRQM